MFFSFQAQLCSFIRVIARREVGCWFLGENVLNWKDFVEKLELLLGHFSVLFAHPSPIILYKKVCYETTKTWITYLFDVLEAVDYEAHKWDASEHLVIV